MACNSRPVKSRIIAHVKTLQRLVTEYKARAIEVARVGAQSAPEPGDLATRGAIAQTFLDECYDGCDSHDLADIMLKHWDVRWKASQISSTLRSSPSEKE
jgi:hypothetical protein